MLPHSNSCARRARIRKVRDAPVTFPLALQRPRRSLDAEHDVASIIGRIDAEESRDRYLFVAAMLGVGKADVDRGAFEVVLENEVDDTADGVGAVHGRRTARNDLDALDRRRGNRVGVDDHGGVDRHGATTVDQHEVTVRAEAAQTDRRYADRVRGRLLHVRRRELRDGGRELRQAVQDRLDADRGRLIEHLLIDRQDRCIRREVLAADARARDGHLIEHVLLGEHVPRRPDRKRRRHDDGAGGGQKTRFDYLAMRSSARRRQCDAATLERQTTMR